MTIDEASQRYGVPMDILREYERLGLCPAVKKVMGTWQYDDSDLEKLSLIMTLHDVGFSTEEVETYMRLMEDGGARDCKLLSMLDQKRTAALDEIHFREKQLDRLDYLRHEIRKKMKDQ